MIGIDLIKTARMDSIMQKFAEKALKKFLSKDEILLVKNYKTAAGFWAVKEATSKALGVGIGADCNFHDIIITKTQKGAPEIALSSRLLEKFNIEDMSVSITHDGEYAIAVVAIQKSSSTTDKI